MLEFLVAYCMQLALTVGVVIVFGLVIAACNRRFYSNFGRGARTVCYVTGFFGTPVHELSHALFCLLFGHRIVEIKLFRIADDGTLGYVSHTYNRRNLWQRMGNFFIGIAPILVITAVLYLIAYLLLPSMTAEMLAAFSGIDLYADLPGSLMRLLGAGRIFFSYALTWQWWVFLLLGSLLALHQTLSRADLKSAMSGLVLLAVLLLVTDGILALVGAGALNAFTRAMWGIGAYMVCFLSLSLLISLLALAFSEVVRLVTGRH